MNIDMLSCHPIEGMPTPEEMNGVTALPSVEVWMTTYVNDQGEPVWLLEQFHDPASGLPKAVWSRVTTALAYVRG